MSTCTLCGAKTNQPICAKCLRGVLLDLNELTHLLTRLESVARREEHVEARSAGHVNPAFAPTPVDLSAMDLLTEAAETLEDICLNSGLYFTGTWRKSLSKLITHKTQLINNPHITTDRERITKLVVKAKTRLTPPSERIIIGRCLNPACGTELSIIRNQTEVTCPYCSSVWQVVAVQAARRERFHEKPLLATPAEAAAWVKKNTGIYVSRKLVNMWAQREPLAAPSCGSDRHSYDMGWLLAHAETMRNSPQKRF